MAKNIFILMSILSPETLNSLMYKTETGEKVVVVFLTYRLESTCIFKLTTLRSRKRVFFRSKLSKHKDALNPERSCFVLTFVCLRGYCIKGTAYLELGLEFTCVFTQVINAAFAKASFLSIDIE